MHISIKETGHTVKIKKHYISLLLKIGKKINEGRKEVLNTMLIV